MEVAAGNPRMVVLKDERVVCHRVNLNIHLVSHIVYRILAGAVNLRTAAQGIGILHADLPLSCGIFASLQKSEKISRRSHLTFVRADLVNSRIQRVHHPILSLKAESCRDVRHLQQANGIVESQGTCARHGLRPVVEGKPLLGGKLNHRDACPIHGLLSGKHLPLVLCQPQTDHWQHHVREGCQIAGSAQRALLRDHRSHTLIQHVHHSLKRFQADAGKSLGKIVDAKQHDPSRNIPGKRLSCADCVSDNQIFLQLLALIM